MPQERRSCSKSFKAQVIVEWAQPETSMQTTFIPVSPDQASLLDDLIDTDIAAIESELEALQPAPVEAKVRQQTKRAPLAPQFPRTLIHHEPYNSPASAVAPSSASAVRPQAFWNVGCH